MTTTQDPLTEPTTQLAVTRGGDPAGPAVLWLHGYTMDSSLWQPVWDLLPGWHHVAVDLPGHGRSGPLLPGTSLSAVAAAVGAVADAHDARRCVALCFGSCVALQMAIDRPALLHTLSVAAPTIGGVLAEPEAAERYKQLAMLKRFIGPGEQMATLWMSSPPDIFRGIADHPAAAERLREVLIRHRWDELVSGAMGTLTTTEQTREQLAAITADSQVIVGDEDLTSMLANTEVLGEVVPRVQVRRLPGVGHLPPLEVPETYAPIVAAALRA